MKSTNSKSIYFTFDYEIFFGESGSVQKCILEPTERLIEIFRRYNMKATFFVDTNYLLRLKEENEITKKDYFLIEAQLIKLVSEGHRIELHLHPHWIDAVYLNESNTWNFTSYDKYRLHSLSTEEIKRNFFEGVSLLEKIAHKIDKKYKVIAFRAGGWCIEPFNILVSSFLEIGLRIDSSVAYGLKRIDKVQNFNFKKAPKKEFYNFSNSSIVIDEKGPFIELPITTYKINFFERLQNFITKKNRKVALHIGDGKGIYEKEKKTYINIKNKFVFSIYTMFDIDMILDIQYLFKKTISQKKHHIVFIGHPKLLDENSFHFITLISNEKNITFNTIYSKIEEFK